MLTPWFEKVFNRSRFLKKILILMNVSSDKEEVINENLKSQKKKKKKVNLQIVTWRMKEFLICSGKLSSISV